MLVIFNTVVSVVSVVDGDAVVNKVCGAVVDDVVGVGGPVIVVTVVVGLNAEGMLVLLVGFVALCVVTVVGVSPEGVLLVVATVLVTNGKVARMKFISSRKESVTERNEPKVVSYHW